MLDSNRDIYTISRLNSELRQVLEGSFPLIWVEGEISNLSQPRSGHLYFSLKDTHAQIRCAMFRNKRNLLRFKVENGQQILARTRIAMYEPRGDCQLIVEHMEPLGDGALQRAFEALKQKLQQEGLFDSHKKHTLPTFPRRIGIISSPSGAAVKDILQVLARRFPAAQVTLYPSSVQGASAVTELRQALKLAQQLTRDEVLILARGGGSLEDLAAFNDEGLARDIAACCLPIVSAVGHEIDFTIADFVADRRAPTPSAAAELVSPDSAALQRQLHTLQQRITLLMKNQLRLADEALRRSGYRLHQQLPGTRIQQQIQHLDDLQLRLQRQIQTRLGSARTLLTHKRNHLLTQHPQHRLRSMRPALHQLQQRLHMAVTRNIRQSREQLKATLRELSAISPLATLERGYSIVTASKGGIISSTRQVTNGSQISIRLLDGNLTATVNSVNETD